MIRILSIETATSICSIAVHENGICTDSLEISESNSHSAKLTVLIEQILAKNSLQISDFSAIAISKGPGSYTGLRIGTSVAKGICYASGLPLLTVDTLQAMALSCKLQLQKENVLQQNSVFMPMIDARRMEVYTSLWDVNMNCLQETNALILTDESIQTFDSSLTYYLLGDGSAKCETVLSKSNIHFVPNITATAVTIGDIAHTLFVKQEFADLAYFEPFYLKEFQGTTPKSKI